MNVRALQSISGAAVGYLLVDGPSGSAIAIDAPEGAAAQVLAAQNQMGFELLILVNTHGHWDTLFDNVALLGQFPVNLAAHLWDGARISDPKLTCIGTDEERQASKIGGCRITTALADGYRLSLGASTLQVIHTPGHTPGSICIYAQREKILFSGDTLLRGEVGSTSRPGGNFDSMTGSLRRLAQLPPETSVLPAHGPATTLREEDWVLKLALAC